MKIGKYDVDETLFNMYVRTIIAVGANPFEKSYDDARWGAHCRILQSIGLEHRFKVFTSTPEKLKTPSRKTSSIQKSPVYQKPQPAPQEVREFNTALAAHVALFLVDY